jgi:type III secretion protein T
MREWSRGVNFSSTFSNSQLFEWLDSYFIAIGISMARMFGLVVIMPAFTRLGLSGILRSAVAIALALPLVPMVAETVAAAHLPAILAVTLMFKEVLIGVMVGLVLGVPIWAAEAAGSMLDVQRGSAVAGLFDPSAATDESVTATLFGLIMVALYFSFGGLPLTLRTVYESYQIWPASNILPTLAPTAGQFLVGLLDNIITMGLVLVAPIVIFMLLADLMLALVARAAPQLNVFALSLNVKNLIFSLLLALYGAFMIKYMGNDLELLLRAGNDLQTLAKPASP